MCWNVLELSNFYTVESFCRAYCFLFQLDLLITICGVFFSLFSVMMADDGGLLCILSDIHMYLHIELNLLGLSTASLNKLRRHSVLWRFPVGLSCVHIWKNWYSGMKNNLKPTLIYNINFNNTLNSEMRVSLYKLSIIKIYSMYCIF